MADLGKIAKVWKSQVPERARIYGNSGPRLRDQWTFPGPWAYYLGQFWDLILLSGSHRIMLGVCTASVYLKPSPSASWHQQWLQKKSTLAEMARLNASLKYKTCRNQNLSQSIWKPIFDPACQLIRKVCRSFCIAIPFQTVLWRQPQDPGRGTRPGSLLRSDWIWSEPATMDTDHRTAGMASSLRWKVFLGCSKLGTGDPKFATRLDLDTSVAASSFSFSLKRWTGTSAAKKFGTTEASWQIVLKESAFLSSTYCEWKKYEEILHQLATMGNYEAKNGNNSVINHLRI